ncbi:MAG: hypothetical protein HY791_24095 [Deltaproteobacteria bacterium]|nr:hypothetical protein [Deltaproteobacteria bacterium]
MSAAIALAACGVGPTAETVALKRSKQPAPEATAAYEPAVSELRAKGLGRVRPSDLSTKPIQGVRLERETLPEKIEGRIPNVGPMSLFTAPGSFSAKSTAAGSATYSGAPVIDWSAQSVPSVGTGAFDVAINGVLHSATNAYSVGGVFDDGAGLMYLVLSAWTQEVDPATGADMATVVHLIVPAADFVPGATVSFDGYDRLAYFAKGDVNLPDPELVAVAATGSVTFGSGGLNLGDLIDATVIGDFAEIYWQPAPPPSGPSTPVPAGTYSLLVDPTPYVWCDGSLLGQEQAFGGITAASLNLVDGSVDVLAIDPSAFDLVGATIQGAFGAPSLRLDNQPDYPQNVYAGVQMGSGAGPAGTDFYAVYLALDSTVSGPEFIGNVGAAYLTPDQMGWCEVDFAVSLAP